MTYDQVWWPILGICALHLSHSKCTHTAVNTHTPRTHTRSNGQPFILWCPGSSWGFSALLKGTSVMVLRVKRALDIHSPNLRFLLARDSNLQPFDYESDSLTIRPRLPRLYKWCLSHVSHSHMPLKKLIKMLLSNWLVTLFQHNFSSRFGLWTLANKQIAPQAPATLSE